MFLSTALFRLFLLTVKATFDLFLSEFLIKKSFIGKEETSTIPKVRKVLDEKTLLVTELKDISNSSSSMINFVYVQSRLKFQLNKSEAEKNNFKIGQTLTKLAYSTI